MNYRVATLLPEESKSAAGTKTIDLDINDIISRIEIKFDLANGSYAHSAAPAADVTKIELVDGSDVLFSMTGYEAQALNIYDRRVGSMNEGCHLANNDDISHYGIDFGRYLWDTQLALDPNKFTNPQLKITYALTNHDSSATSATMEVRAWCFDEKKVSPMGFLMSKEIYSYTCGAASSYEYIDIPVDYPIRKMLIRAYRSTTQPCDTISEFRIDENMEQKIPMDFNTETYFSFMIMNYWDPVYELMQLQVSTDAKPDYITPSWYWKDVNLATVNAAPATWQTNTAAGTAMYVDSTAGSQVWGSVTGFLPNHCFEVPFGNDQDIADWYNVTTKSKVRLRLKAGGNGTNGTAQVVLQQIRRY